MHSIKTYIYLLNLSLYTTYTGQRNIISSDKQILIVNNGWILITEYD